MEKAIIIGAGITGATMARLLADNGVNVTIVDERAQIGGNIYDYTDKNGIIVQSYGPHVFHTNQKKVFDFLSRFTEWEPYYHKVSAKIKGKCVPVPFNLTSLFSVFPKEKAEKIKKALINEIGENKQVPVMLLKTHENEEIREFGDFVYKNIFYKYTKKQWGIAPDKLCGDVISRVPVYISNDDKYFSDAYQFMPKYGFTKMITNMLRHPRINIKLKTTANRYLALYDGKIYWKGAEFDGMLFYTGRVDELFDYKFGSLTYRSLRFKFKTLNIPSYQETAVVNYTTTKKYTRITEFTKFTCKASKKTIIAKEYVKKYRKKDSICIPVLTNKNSSVYDRYVEEVKKFPNVHLVGELASFKYINMDKAVENAIDTFDKVYNECEE